MDVRLAKSKAFSFQVRSTISSSYGTNDNVNYFASLSQDSVMPAEFSEVIVGNIFEKQLSCKANF